jgi:phosphonate transport system ATP-binding protein
MTFRLEKLTVRHLAATAQAPAALHELDLDVAPGEQLALIGPSGAGKTTLLATLACAHRPQSSDVGGFSVFGQDPWALPQSARHRLRARLFLAPQTPPLPPRQRVVTAVLAARLPHMSLWQAFASLVRPSDPDAAHAALARFGLGDKLYARVDRLSGGERQRCGLARLLLSSAEAFLVDEPISALDPALARHTLATLQQEASARKASLVCSLHQVEMARAHFPRLVGLRAGRIVFDAPTNAVSDAMIAALYENEAVEAPPRHPHEPPERIAVGACF